MHIPHARTRHTNIGNRRSDPWLLTFYTLLRRQLSNVCHNFSLSHIHNLITIDKKYTLSYVYWDHTNTSQGYINIRFFSLCYFFSFWVFFTMGTTRRDFLRSYEIPRFLSLVFFFFFLKSNNDTVKYRESLIIFI